LKAAFSKSIKKVSYERQAFSLPPPEGAKRGQSIKDGELPLRDGDTIIFKDLGPQISWKTVFLIEYLGPMLAFPLFYLLRPFIYSGNTDKPLHETQWIGFILFTAHFAKRELETLFVHKFSHGTMPLFNLFKNSGYYWLYAFYCAYFVLHPEFTSPSKTIVYTFAVLFVICELCNLYCHIILSNLRPPGTKIRKIPRGFLFNYVSCANYTFEIAAWACYTVMVSSLAALLFTVTGAGQMTIWAIGKHRNYIKEFDGKDGREKYPRRYIIFPFIF
jgi:very-long-chain enoyl-CoA reductase